MKNKSVTNTTKAFMDLSKGEHSLEEVLELAGVKPEPQVDLNGKEEYEVFHPKDLFYPEGRFCPRCGLELDFIKNISDGVIVRSFWFCPACYWDSDIDYDK